jgi:hypothetical protein
MIIFLTLQTVKEERQKGRKRKQSNEEKINKEKRIVKKEKTKKSYKQGNKFSSNVLPPMAV